MKRLLLAVLTLLMLLGIIPALAEESSALPWVENMGLATEYTLDNWDCLKVDPTLPDEFSDTGLGISLYKTVAETEDVVVGEMCYKYGRFGIDDLSTKEGFEDGATYYIMFSLNGESAKSTEFAIYTPPTIKVLLNGESVSGTQTLKAGDALSVESNCFGEGRYASQYSDCEVYWLIKAYGNGGDKDQPYPIRANTITAEQVKAVLTENSGSDAEVRIFAMLGKSNKTTFDDLYTEYGGKLNGQIWVKVADDVTCNTAENLDFELVAKATDGAGNPVAMDGNNIQVSEGSELNLSVDFMGGQGAFEVNWSGNGQTASGETEGAHSSWKFSSVTVDKAGTYTCEVTRTRGDVEEPTTKSVTFNVSVGKSVTYRLIDDKSEYDVVKIYDKGSSITLPGYHDAEELGELNSALTEAKHAEDTENSNEYYITGWRNSESYDELPLGATLTLNDALVLVAQSYAIDDYTEKVKVTFKPGSYHGTAVAGSEYALSDVYFGSQLAAPDPADLGCTAPGEGVEFLGWVEDGDSNGNPVKAGESVSVYSSMDLVYVAKWAKPVTLTLVKADASQKVFETVTDWQGSANKIYEGDTLESYEIGEVVEEYNNAASNGDKLQRGWYLDADGDEEYDAGEEYWLYGAGKGITLEESLTLRAWLVDPVVIKYQVSGEEEKAITRYYRPGESCWLASSMGELFGQDGYEEDRRVIQYWMDTDSKRYETDSRFMAEKDMTFTAYVLENEAPTVYLTKTGNYIIDGSYSRENFSANIQNATHWSWEYSSDLTNWTSIGYGTVEDSKGFSIRAGSGSSSTHLHYMDGAGRLYYRVIAWNAGETAISSITDLTDSMPHAYSDSVSITVVDSTYNLYTYTANFKFEDGTEMDGGSSVGKPKCVMKDTDIKIQAVCSCSGIYYATIKGDGYTWYESDDGVTWTVMSGNTTDMITVNEATANVKYYRYSATAEWNENEYAIGSEALKVYFSTPVEITAQPTIAEKLYSGDKATLSITASNTMSYQWQKKVGNGSWQDISGAILPSYTYTAPETDSAMSVSFRCGVESVATSETIYSKEAETTVMPKPTTGDLTLSLGEISGTNVPEEVSVELKITLKKGEEAIPDGTYGAAAFASGVGYVTLSRSGESKIALLDAENTASDTAVITGIPMNTSYTVASTNSSYTVTSGASGTIDSAAAAVTLNFKYQKASNDAMVKDDEIRTEGGATNDDINVTAQLKDNSDINVKDIYSVEINWGDMKFKYVTTQHKKNVWNAESHTYSTEDDTDKPDDHEWKLYTASGLNLSEDAGKIVTGADQSYVVVFNHSNRPVDVQLANEASKVSGVTVNLVDKLNTGTDGVYALDAGVEGTVYDATTGAAAKVNVSGDPDDVNDLAQETEETPANNPTVLTQLKVTISKHTAAEEE